uniref:CD177 antigen n=1 Tax=Mus spicilegus TaxID=10103 RepID=A0A8C6HY17_MUSSI
MGACRIQYVLLLSLLGFCPCSDTLNCQKGIMVKFGSGFTKSEIEWKSPGTTETAPEEICQETLLLIDVGEKSLILASKGSSKAGSKSVHDVQVFSGGPGIVTASYVHFCDTELCNSASSTSVLLNNMKLSGGLKNFFSLDGCLANSAKNLLKSQTSIGIFSVVEVSNPDSSKSPSRVVPSILLTWMLGLRALLSSLYAGICPLC